MMPCAPASSSRATSEYSSSPTRTMGVMPASSSDADHVVHGLQVEGPVLHIDEDVVEARRREGARNLRRPVDLQPAPEDRLAFGERSRV